MPDPTPLDVPRAGPHPPREGIASTPCIVYDRVTVAAGGKTILTDLVCTIRAGERVVLRGRSGSGKSTFLKCLLGLYPLQAGRILFDGRELGSATVPAVRAAAAYIGQEPVLGADGVRDALLLPFRFKAHRQATPAEAELRAALERLQLSAEILGRDCRRISGGEKQRVALARALLLRKRLYLLDEVTSALDPESKAAVLLALAEPGLTLVSVSHDPDWIGWCDTAYELEQGGLRRLEVHGRG